MPVGSFEFGMGPFGTYDMAGNVAEWCVNPTTEGFTTAGASWDDLSYMFAYVGEFPGLQQLRQARIPLRLKSGRR